MSNTIVVLKDVHGDELRLDLSWIGMYKPYGGFTYLQTKNGDVFHLENSVEELDKIFVESFYMLKRF
jgi:hypothetical protein